MKRRGMTLVELLVCLGVIALLLALLLPVVQSVRESARRTHCQSNLRQIMLAAQSHHSTQGALPSFYNGTSLSYPHSEWHLFHLHSWRVPLLPYLEQSALRDRIKWDALATDAVNLPVAQSPVSVFLCPSTGDPMKMGRGLRYDAGDIPTVNLTDDGPYWYFTVRSDYDAMAGIQVLPKPFPPDARPASVDFVRWGIWGWPDFSNKETSGSRLTRYRAGMFRDVTDGLSNTIALVERAGKPKAYKRGKLDVTSDNPNAEYPGQGGWSASNTFAWSLNTDGTGVNESNSCGIYSFHGGGAYVAIADGSVRFLADTTDFDTLVKLYGRSDGGLPE